jgi:hypothetical protein
MSRMISSLWIPQALHAAAVLGLGDALAQAPLTSSELAARLLTHPDATERLCKALAFLEVLEERDATFALTELGRCLVDGTRGSRRAWALLLCGEKVWSQWGQLAECVRTGRPAFTAAPFAQMEREPVTSSIFHQAMSEMTSDVAPSICDALELGSVQSIVDIGGGWGTLLCSVLERATQARGVVFDLENARAGALAQFERRALGERASYVAGDMFESPPPQADLYLIKSVIHDWDDEKSCAILSRCRESMSAQARLCVIEPPAPATHDSGLLGFFTAFSDLNMLVVAGGRERTEVQYRVLLESAGLRVLPPRRTKSFYQVFEAVCA